MTDPWRDLCRHLVPEVLKERDWRLIPDDELPEFTEQVHQTITDGVVRARPGSPPAKTVRRATIHCYCHVLYRASGQAGTRRQRRAFEELGRHAQGVAWRYTRDPDIVQEAAQRALVITWEKRDQVRDPGSFLRWIETVVYREVRELRKGDTVILPPREDPDDRAVRRFWETLETISLSGNDPTVQDVMERELREQLLSEVERVLGGNPRYQAVIIGHFFYGLNLPTLAEMLGTPVRNVYVLKSRALAKLRNDSDFIARFADALEAIPGKGKGNP